MDQDTETELLVVGRLDLLFFFDKPTQFVKLQMFIIEIAPDSTQVLDATVIE